METGRSKLGGLLVLMGTLAAASLALTACGASEGAAPNDDVATGDAGPGAPTTTPPSGTSNDAGQDAGEPPPPPCDETQAATIQAAFESTTAAPAAVNAVAFVRDPSCGDRYFTRGPAKYPAETVQLLGSNTKTYVASAVLLLADDGVVSLDDPVAKYVPSVPGGDAVKVRHLLNHTSGIADYGGDFTFMIPAILGIAYTPDQLISKAFAKAVAFQPGASVQYCNTNFVLLGMIAEKASGKPLESLIRERILEPIGANATFFHGKESIAGDVAFGKTFLGSNGASISPSFYWAAGAYGGTPSDLAKWVEIRGSGKFHSAAANAELFTKQVDPKLATNPGVTFGAGIMHFVAPSMHLTGDAEAWGHPGEIMGYYSYGLYYPKTKTTIVVVVDSDDGPNGAAPLNGFVSYLDPLYFSVSDTLFGYAPP